MPRLSVNITVKTALQIRELQESRETSATKVVQDAIWIYSHLHREMTDGEKKLKLVDRNGCETWLEFL